MLNNVRLAHTFTTMVTFSKMGALIENKSSTGMPHASFLSRITDGGILSYAVFCLDPSATILQECTPHVIMTFDIGGIH